MADFSKASKIDKFLADQHLEFSGNDWQTLRGEKIYENPWIRVEHHDVINPAGNPGIYGAVFFKNIAIAILPLDELGFTYLVGQYRYMLGTYSWEIPEGGCPEGEDPLDAARRELKEETGLVAASWAPVLEMDISNSVTNERSISYLATGLTQGAPLPEDTENLQVKRMLLSDVVELIYRGEIRDALTIATVLKVWTLRKP